MARPQGGYDPAKVDVIVYGAYLAAFIALLAASIQLFGVSWLTITFGLFIAAVIAIVAFMSRLM